MDVFEHIVDKVIVVLDGVVASSSRPHGAFLSTTSFRIILFACLDACCPKTFCSG